MQSFLLGREAALAIGKRGKWLAKSSLFYVFVRYFED